jgi:FkbM family methyltransferase
MIFLIPRLLNRIGILNLLNLQAKVKLNQQVFKIPVIAGVGFGNRAHTEPWLDKVFREIFSLQPNSCFIDVGVNLGQTLLKVKSIDANMAYYGIEPSPTCVNYVNTLCKLNNIKQIQLICAGAAEHNTLEVLEGFSAEDTRGTMKSGSLSDDPSLIKTLVPTITLDILLHKKLIGNKPIVLKIDVERYELQVLKGATELLEKVRPVIFCEVLPHLNQTDNIHDQQQLLSLLNHAGYIIYRVSVSGNIEPVKTFSNTNDWDACEYIFIPAEHPWASKLQQS